MAQRRTKFEIVPSGPNWEIKRNGKSFLTVLNRQVAIDEAIIQAKQASPSRLVLKRPDGTVEEEAQVGELRSTSTKATKSAKPATARKQTAGAA